jgi:hypothetical protein
MITFSKLGHHGRLGNQLYQLAILKKISLLKGYDIMLDNEILDRNWHGQKNLLHNFKLNSFNFVDKSMINIQKNYHEKYDWEFDKNLLNISDNHDLYGFFCCAKYYEDIQSYLVEEFELKDSLIQNVNKILDSYKNPIVSLHVRRGDNTDGTTLKNNWKNNYHEGTILYDYHKKSLSLIPENSTILVFTGGARNNDLSKDIEWCKNNLKDDRMIFMENLSDIESFAIMTLVDINILSPTSTFGLWAAFLNKNKNVIAPKNYFGNKNIDPLNVYPSYFKLI